MTAQIVLKTKDICNALEIGRHQLRAWVDHLPPYSQRAKKERSACKYDPADLLYFAVIKYVTKKYSLPISFLSKFSHSLYSCIREPQSLTLYPFIFINGQGTSCSRIALDRISQEGIIIDLQPSQSVVYQYLGISSQQAQLQFGLGKVG